MINNSIIISLDIASTTGYAIEKDGEISLNNYRVDGGKVKGKEDLRINLLESSFEVHFRDLIMSFVSNYKNIDIFYEMAHIGKSKSQILFYLHSTLRYLVRDLKKTYKDGINLYEPIAPSAWQNAVSLPYAVKNYGLIRQRGRNKGNWDFLFYKTNFDGVSKRSQFKSESKLASFLYTRDHYGKRSFTVDESDAYCMIVYAKMLNSAIYQQ